MGGLRGGWVHVRGVCCALARSPQRAAASLVGRLTSRRVTICSQACNERQRAFEGKQAEMRQQVAKFEKFISENDAKRDRAEAKVAPCTHALRASSAPVASAPCDCSLFPAPRLPSPRLPSPRRILLRARPEKTKAERAAYRVKCREQEKLEAELAAEETEREALASRLDRVRRYQAYLERTVDVAEDADEVWDLLHRYQTLRSANKDLMGQVQAGQGAIDEMRSDLQATTSAHTNAVLVQNSQVRAPARRHRRSSSPF